MNTVHGMMGDKETGVVGGGIATGYNARFEQKGKNPPSVFLEPFSYSCSFQKEIIKMPAGLKIHGRHF